MAPTFCAIFTAEELGNAPLSLPAVGRARAGDGDLEGLGEPNREFLSSSSEAIDELSQSTSEPRRLFKQLLEAKNI